MDYEEKLRLAKEAIKSGSYDRNTIEYIFPELKESEDERIRKRLIEEMRHFQREAAKESCDADFDFAKSAIAWLEKQGKSKFEQCIQEGDKIVTNEDGTHFNVSQLERVAKKEPKKISSFCREHCKGYQETGRCFVDGECQAKKNAEAAWSEEDENMLKSIIATCELAEQDRDSSPARHLFEMQSNWLKSLKERMKPQWKPSERHISILKDAIEYFDSIGAKSSKIVLEDLLEQLKKL